MTPSLIFLSFSHSCCVLFNPYYVCLFAFNVAKLFLTLVSFFVRFHQCQKNRSIATSRRGIHVHKAWFNPEGESFPHQLISHRTLFPQFSPLFYPHFIANTIADLCCSIQQVITFNGSQLALPPILQLLRAMQWYADQHLCNQNIFVSLFSDVVNEFRSAGCLGCDGCAAESGQQHSRGPSAQPHPSGPATPVAGREATSSSGCREPLV